MLRVELVGLEIAKRTWQPYNEGMRRRLLVRFADGSKQFFVMAHVDAVAADLRVRLFGAARPLNRLAAGISYVSYGRTPARVRTQLITRHLKQNTLWVAQ